VFFMECSNRELAMEHCFCDLFYGLMKMMLKDGRCWRHFGFQTLVFLFFNYECS